MSAVDINVMDPSELVDVARYPLDGRDLPASEPRHTEYWSAVGRARSGLRADGCALLKDDLLD